MLRELENLRDSVEDLLDALALALEPIIVPSADALGRLARRLGL